jgi:hypothetical protein
MSTLGLLVFSVSVSVFAGVAIMQVEEQKQQSTDVPGESRPIKKQHGGKRAGSGRKPNAANIVLKGTTRTVLLQALENVDPQLVAGRITKLLNSKRELIWLQTLNFIYDRVLGKPKQDVNVSGAFVHAEVRDPLILGWPREALVELANRYDDAYRDIARKFGLDAAQNGPGFQDKSTVAIEAEVVESEAANRVESAP